MNDSLVGTLRHKKKQILTLWMKNQLADSGLRDDLMSNDDLRAQSEELLDTLFEVLTDENLSTSDSAALGPLFDLLSGISLSRARQGFTPRETGTYIFSLKDALLEVVQQEYKETSQQLLNYIIQISKFVDNLGIVTFE